MSEQVHEVHMEHLASCCTLQKAACRLSWQIHCFLACKIAVLDLDVMWTQYEHVQAAYEAECSRDIQQFQLVRSTFGQLKGQDTTHLDQSRLGQHQW